MKTFSFNGSLNDLKQFGIDPLTGEACAIGCRILCDLTRTGVRVIEAAFGLPPRRELIIDGKGTNLFPSFHENHNSGARRDPSVASVMLFHDMAQDLAIIGMFEVHGCQTVALFGDAGPGLRNLRNVEGYKLEADENFSVIQAHVGEMAAEYVWDDNVGDSVLVRPAQHGYLRSITPINQPRRGLACVHAMTGRSM